MNQFRSLLLLIFVVLVVPVLFMSLDKGTAAIIASVLFALASILVVQWVGLQTWSGKIALFFLFFFVVPILSLRLMDKDEEFRNLLHSLSTVIYFIWLIVVAIETFRKPNRR